MTGRPLAAGQRHQRRVPASRGSRRERRARRCRSRGSSRLTCRSSARRGAAERSMCTSHAIRSIARSRSITTRAASCATTTSLTATWDDVLRVLRARRGRFRRLLRQPLVVVAAAQRAERAVSDVRATCSRLRRPRCRAIAAFLGGRGARARARRAASRATSFAIAASSTCAATKIAGRARGPTDMPAFVRKGVVGDWRNHFSAAAGAPARREVSSAHARQPGSRSCGPSRRWPQTRFRVRAHERAECRWTQ